MNTKLIRRQVLITDALASTLVVGAAHSEAGSHASAPELKLAPPSASNLQDAPGP
jgi:hypothetical protein